MDTFQNEIRIGRITTSEKEIRDILKAWLLVSFAFAVVLSGSVFTSEFYAKFIISSLTVGVGFLLHELGHKIVAQRYGCLAEFRSFDSMLLLAVLMSFFGFVFAAPGAVMIAGHVSKRKSGWISAAGPIVNLLLAAVFLALTFVHLPPLLAATAFYGFTINSWLALFNMIPFGLFDGKKILGWSRIAYGLIVAAAFSFMIVQYFLPMAKV